MVRSSAKHMCGYILAPWTCTSLMGKDPEGHALMVPSRHSRMPGQSADANGRTSLRH